jgi:uncharacterized membrane protein YeaQ/YmgE (transglycosylase-associated protein family)
MNLKRETQGAIEQSDAGQPRSPSSILRKRVIGVLLLVLGALVLTGYAYYWSTFTGSTHWLSFWAREVIVGALVVIIIVQALRKRSKL